MINHNFRSSAPAHFMNTSFSQDKKVRNLKLLIVGLEVENFYLFCNNHIKKGTFVHIAILLFYLKNSPQCNASLQGLQDWKINIFMIRLFTIFQSSTWRTFDNFFGAAFEMSKLPEPPLDLRLTAKINGKRQQLVLR